MGVVTPARIAVIALASIALYLRGSPAVALAQTAKPGGAGEAPERLAGLTIERISIEAPPQEDKAQLLALTGLAEGRPYVASEIRRALKVLYQLDRFENVYVSAARTANAVSLELVLPPRPRVQEIEIIGNDSLAASDIEEALELHTGSELDMRTFSARRERLAAAYRRIGHRSPAIGIAATRADANGNHDITLRIDEGPRTRLRRVIIDGVARRPMWILRSSAGVGPGDVLNLNEVESALAELEADYRKRGYLEVEIGEPEVREVDPGLAGDREPTADLILDIEAGPLISVRFAGYNVVSLRELEQAASVMSASEIGASQAALNEVVERILSRYERRGYWKAEVKPFVRVSKNGAKKEILFAIREGKGSYVSNIRFLRTAAGPEGASSRLSDDLLRSKVLEVVEDTLSEEIGKPGADPQLVASILGDRSLQKPRDSRQPDTSSPNPRRVYVPRAYNAAADAITDLYRAEGYQTAQTVMPKTSTRADGTLVDVGFEVHEGVRWELGALSFSGNESMGSTQLLELAKLDPQKEGGEPLSFYNVEEARRAILAHYQNEGYLYARIDEGLREVPERGSLSASEFVTTSTTAALRLRDLCRTAEARGKPSCAVELVFHIAEGPQVRTKNVVVRGVESTRESLVRGELAVKEGEILRESDMVTTKVNLLRIGVFERVSVRPLDEKNEAPEKDVICEVRERKMQAFEVGAGASTAEGVRVFSAYTHDNMFGTALKLQINGKVNVQPFLILYDDAIRGEIERFYQRYSAFQRIERELALGLSYPRIFGLPPGFGGGLDLGLSRDLSPQFVQDSFSATLRLDYKGLRPVLNEKQRPITFQVRANFDFAVLECPDTSLTMEPETLQPCTSGGAKAGTSTYATLGPLVSFDLRDDPLNPSAGAYFELEAGFAKGLNIESDDFVKVEGTAAFYLPVTNGVGFAFSVFAGEIFLLEGSSVPINRRFFAGGSKTIRGYADQSLFARDHVGSETISPGGNLVVALKTELRFPISGALSGAVFYDIGDLFESADAFQIGSGSAQGVGIGFRYATPVGPLSLDLGVPLVLRGEGAEGGVQLHFSVRSF